MDTAGRVRERIKAENLGDALIAFLTRLGLRQSVFLHLASSECCERASRPSFCSGTRSKQFRNPAFLEEPIEKPPPPGLSIQETGTVKEAGRSERTGGVELLRERLSCGRALCSHRREPDVDKAVPPYAAPQRLT